MLALFLQECARNVLWFLINPLACDYAWMSWLMNIHEYLDVWICTNDLPWEDTLCMPYCCRNVLGMRFSFYVSFYVSCWSSPSFPTCPSFPSFPCFPFCHCFSSLRVPHKSLLHEYDIHKIWIHVWIPHLVNIHQCLGWCLCINALPCDGDIVSYAMCVSRLCARMYT